LANWYVDVLGLKKGFGNEGWQELETANGSRFALDFIGYPSSTVQKQSMVISFAVADIHAAVRDLKEKGVRFYPDNDIEKTVFDVGQALVATCEDPDGNFFQLSQQKEK
jgi:uncharacterized glyoxalase superfamily protein PhnB